MKTWYCVTSSFDDKGRVTAAVTATQRAEKKPDGTYASNRHRDIYTNWFGSRKEALAYVEECKQAYGLLGIPAEHDAVVVSPDKAVDVYPFAEIEEGNTV